MKSIATAILLLLFVIPTTVNMRNVDATNLFDDDHERYGCSVEEYVKAERDCKLLTSETQIFAVQLNIDQLILATDQIAEDAGLDHLIIFHIIIEP